MRSIKGDFGALFRHVHVLEEGAVGVVSLLLDRGAKLEQVFGDRLVSCLEDVDQPVCVWSGW